MFQEFIFIMIFIGFSFHIIVYFNVEEDWVEKLWKLKDKNSLYFLLFNFLWYLPVIAMCFSYICKGV